jgi:phosphatidyl-myo-inositol dimannoside synthase
MILALQTSTFGAYGGIPTYNRVVSRVLNEFEYPSEKRLLAATDPPSLLSSYQAQLPNLILKGFSGRRTAFVSHILWLALTQKIDLVLVGHVHYAPLGWILKLIQPRLNYGVVMYGIEAWQQLTAFRRHALQHADFSISISEYTKQMAVGMNVLNGNRISLLPNALEGSIFDSVAATTYSQPIVGTRLLSVCRLDRTEGYKGVDTVIEALPEMVKRIPGIQYTVVGGGSDLERHQKMAEKLGVGERVDFRGFVDDETLQSCYRDCDVFVMPSAGEGFGFVFLEAMKYGKAVVAANRGGAPEVVQDGITGSLVEYANKNQLADTLIDLCLDLNKRQRLGQAGYQRLHEEFTFTQFKQKLTEILMKELAPKFARSQIPRFDDGSPQIPQ